MDDESARTFHRAGADWKVHLAEPPITHSLSIGLEVAKILGNGLTFLGCQLIAPATSAASDSSQDKIKPSDIVKLALEHDCRILLTRQVARKHNTPAKWWDSLDMETQRTLNVVLWVEGIGEPISVLKHREYPSGGVMPPVRIRPLDA